LNGLELPDYQNEPCVHEKGHKEAYLREKENSGESVVCIVDIEFIAT
jgi:hypothetical protein